MSVISVVKDPTAYTMTLVAEFMATPEQVWALWEDPRQLERWWGPPTFPATFTRHEFNVGGQSRYHMTGPAGEVSRGWWQVEGLEKCRRIEFVNGLAGDDGEPKAGVSPMPTLVRLEPTEVGTRMTTFIEFGNAKLMETMLDMGMEEGMTSAMGQMDALLSR